MKTEHYKFKGLLLSLFLIPFFTVFSQTSDDFCATPDQGKTEIEELECEPDPNGTIQLYWDIDTYKPMMDGILLHNSPIKTIDVNFNIFQKQDGTGNFEDTPEDKARLIQILDWVNDKFANYGPSDDVPGVTVDELPNYDSRIRLSLGNAGQERIYYYPNNELYCETTWSGLKAGIEEQDINRLDQLNICFVGGYKFGHLLEENIHITNGGSGYTSPPDVIFSSSLAQAESVIENGSVVNINLILPGSHSGCPPLISFEGGGGSGATAYCTLISNVGGQTWPLPDETLNKDISVKNYKNNGNPNGDFSRATNITHEFGHVLDINHVTSTYSCEDDDDYLWDIFGLPNPGNCPHNSSCEDSGASTDDACTNNIMGNKESHYISPRQAGKMHRSLALLTTRRYVNVNSYIANEPLVVTEDELWDFNIKLYRDIVVEAGVELTITCKVVMPWEGRIIVKPSAKLIIDGGTITTDAEGYLWKGIEVRGNINQHQYTIDDYCAQGQLILKNGAIIEKGRVTIGGYYENGNWDMDLAGGIITVIGNNSLETPAASFLNSGNSLKFFPYENFHPDYPPFVIVMPNLSRLSNALFEVNNNYSVPSSQPWNRSHLELFGVQGIAIKGCTFSNETSHPNMGKGIYCAPGPGKLNYSSGFSASSICTSQINPCAEESLDKCQFKNLEYGIKTWGTGIYTITVEDAVFDNNSYGIHMINTNNASILFSEFYVGPASDNDTEECGSISSGYGIYMDNCTGFAIEENFFTKAEGAPSGNYTGIGVTETQAADEIYKNYFEGLKYGNYTEGKNWDGTYTWSGLEFLCNDNTGNFADFVVAYDPVNPSGIQSFQGDPVYPAGNSFSPTGANFHFYNGGDYQIDYYYCPSAILCENQTPSTFLNYYIEEKVAATINECLSHYGGIGENPKDIVLSPEQIIQTEQDYYSALTDYNNTKALYDNLKDGGNTEALITDVETAWPTDMWELRAKLLGGSPHLSMEVLKTAADKTDVLPDDVIFEIMAANPDELKKEELLKYLEDKENPLPQYMIDILNQLATGTTYKTVLQQQMSTYGHNKARAAHDMIRSIVNDTISDLLGLRNWLDNLGGIRADHQIIDTYLAEENSSDALALANMLPTLYKLEGNELDEHDFYMDMLNLQINLNVQGRNLFELDSIEVSNLVYIAESSKGVGGAQARGILELAHGYAYCNCLNENDTSGTKSSGMINPDILAKVNGIDISAEPNPASEWVAFNYTMPGMEAEAVITINDISGKQVATLAIEGKQGQKVWDTRNIKPGIYFYTLNVAGQQKSGKIVISK